MQLNKKGSKDERLLIRKVTHSIHTHTHIPLDDDDEKNQQKRNSINLYKIVQVQMFFHSYLHTEREKERERHTHRQTNTVCLKNAFHFLVQRYNINNNHHQPSSALAHRFSHFFPFRCVYNAHIHVHLNGMTVCGVCVRTRAFFIFFAFLVAAHYLPFRSYMATAI